MKKIISIRKVHIGEGMPKIIVPLMGTNKDQLIVEVNAIKQVNPDIVEWRADMLEAIENLSEVKKVLSCLRDELYPIPLLFTFRSHHEGGNKHIDVAYYEQLLTEVAETKHIDLLDVELFSPAVHRIVEIARANDIVVVMSNHDFEKTPEKEEIISRLKRMQELGADIPKIAVMPQNPKDVLTLLDATYMMNSLYADRPIITMSMASTGMVSRIAGQVFGSAATFGSVVEASAPGQIPAGELRKMMDILHTS